MSGRTTIRGQVFPFVRFCLIVIKLFPFRSKRAGATCSSNVFQFIIQRGSLAVWNRPAQETLRLLLWTTFLLAFSALLPIINPVGSALIFLGVVGDAPPEVFRSLARRIAINNIIFLGVIELVGSLILRFFGISLPVIQLAGGLVITSIGWTLLNQKDADATTQNKQEEADANDDKTKALEGKSFYPFTFPITSGPGTLVVTLTLSAHATRTTPLEYGLSHGGVFLAIVVISILCYFCYAYAPRLTRAIAPGTVHGILRVMAFIVLSIGVQIMWNGFRTLYSQLPPR